MSNEQYLEDEKFMDLPPVKPPAKTGEAQPSAQNAQQEAAPVKQLGTERNPELPAAQGQGAPSATQAQTNQVSQQSMPPSDNESNDASSVLTTTAMPGIADDSDLIEKEWVEKAQEVIKRTKDDPHTQSKELGQVKAEYLKKRFDRKLNSDKEAK